MSHLSPLSSPSAPSSLTFHLIPHTHWDREWYLTRARSEEHTSELQSL